MVLFVSGGLQGGYKAGESFVQKRKGSANFSVSSEGYFNFADSDWWGSVVTNSPMECCRLSLDQSSIKACANWRSTKMEQYEMVSQGPDPGCTPEARAMHTVTWGKFANPDTASLLVYGGVDATGKALEDLWYVDLAPKGKWIYPVTFVSLLNMADISTADPNDVVTDFKMILLSFAETFDSSAALDLFNVYYIQDSNMWAIQGRTDYWCAIAGDPAYWPDSISMASIPKFNVFANTTIESCNVDGSVFDVGLEQTLYNDSAYCNRSRVGNKCMRGICMDKNTGSVFFLLIIYY